MEEVPAIILALLYLLDYTGWIILAGFYWLYYNKKILVVLYSTWCVMLEVLHWLDSRRRQQFTAKPTVHSEAQPAITMAEPAVGEGGAQRRPRPLVYI